MRCFHGFIFRYLHLVAWPCDSKDGYGCMHAFLLMAYSCELAVQCQSSIHWCSLMGEKTGDFEDSSMTTSLVLRAGIHMATFPLRLATRHFLGFSGLPVPSQWSVSLILSYTPTSAYKSTVDDLWSPVSDRQHKVAVCIPTLTMTLLVGKVIVEPHTDSSNLLMSVSNSDWLTNYIMRRENWSVRQLVILLIRWSACELVICLVGCLTNSWLNIYWGLLNTPSHLSGSKTKLDINLKLLWLFFHILTMYLSY